MKSRLFKTYVFTTRLPEVRAFVSKRSALLKGSFFAVVTIVIWVSFIIIARASATGALSSFDIAALRILGASFVIFPFAWWSERRALRLHAKHSNSFWGLSPLPFKLTSQMGLGGGLIYAVFSYTGFFFAPAAHASVLLPGSLPLWTSLIAWVLLAQALNQRRLIGLGLILVGDFWVGAPSFLNLSNNSLAWFGDLLFIFASISWSFYTVLVRLHNVPPVHATRAVTVFSFFTYIPLYSLLVYLGWIPSHLFEATPGELAFQFFFQGLLSTVVSGITFNQMIRYFGPIRSTMITAVVPGLSGVGASLILDEAMRSNVIAGLILVTIGILFGVQRVVKVRA